MSELQSLGNIFDVVFNGINSQKTANQNMRNQAAVFSSVNSGLANRERAKNLRRIGSEQASLFDTYKIDPSDVGAYGNSIRAPRGSGANFFNTQKGLGEVLENDTIASMLKAVNQQKDLNLYDKINLGSQILKKGQVQAFVGDARKGILTPSGQIVPGSPASQPLIDARIEGLRSSANQRNAAAAKNQAKADETNELLSFKKGNLAAKFNQINALTEKNIFETELVNTKIDAAEFDLNKARKFAPKEFEELEAKISKLNAATSKIESEQDFVIAKEVTQEAITKLNELKARIASEQNVKKKEVLSQQYNLLLQKTKAAKQVVDFNRESFGDRVSLQGSKAEDAQNKADLSALNLGTARATQGDKVTQESIETDIKEQELSNKKLDAEIKKANAKLKKMEIAFTRETNPNKKEKVKLDVEAQKAKIENLKAQGQNLFKTGELKEKQIEVADLDIAIKEERLEAAGYKKLGDFLDKEIKQGKLNGKGVEVKLQRKEREIFENGKRIKIIEAFNPKTGESEEKGRYTPAPKIEKQEIEKSDGSVENVFLNIDAVLSGNGNPVVYREPKAKTEAIRKQIEREGEVKFLRRKVDSIIDRLTGNRNKNIKANPGLVGIKGFGNRLLEYLDSARGSLNTPARNFATDLRILALQLQETLTTENGKFTEGDIARIKAILGQDNLLATAGDTVRSFRTIKEILRKADLKNPSKPSLEGRTATGSNGTKLINRNGKWVPIEGENQ